MQTLFENSIALIIAFQNAGEWLVVPMKFFSNLGTEDFFFAVLPLIYWSIDASLGLRVGFILATSDMLNYVMKLCFAGPRPYWVSTRVRAQWPETTFGVPSGHAQNAMSIWGIIAVHTGRTWVWIVAGLFILLIGVSRVYLGAHFPHDVLVGWALGGILLYLFSRFWEPVRDWFVKRTTLQQAWYAFLISVVCILIGFSAATWRGGFQVPDEWIANAQLNGTDAPNPVDANGIFTSAGTLFGLALGVVWMNRYGGYEASGPLWQRALRYVIGLIGVLIFWMGLGAVFPRGDGFMIYILRYLRYALVGLWVAGGAPWVFMRLKLAKQPSGSI